MSTVSRLAMQLPVLACGLMASTAMALTALPDNATGAASPAVERGIGHVFVAARSGTALVSPGTRIGFDDLWSGDFNYFDLRFAFLNAAASKISVAAVPEPTNWAMLIAGFGLTGTMLRRRRSLHFA
jgi:PEP-CTERM motif